MTNDLQIVSSSWLTVSYISQWLFKKGANVNITIGYELHIYYYSIKIEQSLLNLNMN